MRSTDGTQVGHWLDRMAQAQAGDCGGSSEWWRADRCQVAGFAGALAVSLHGHRATAVVDALRWGLQALVVGLTYHSAPSSFCLESRGEQAQSWGQDDGHVSVQVFS